MKRKCDKCDRPATYHDITIVNGTKIEKHLCDQHAGEEGLVAKSMHKPIHELLNNFVKQHSGEPAKKSDTCPDCGLTFEKFRELSLLGCATCYQAFETQLAPLLERAHEGATHHIGKVPRRAGASEHRQAQLLRMRKQLEEAVAQEDYEEAARIRDTIRTMEDQPS